MMLYIRAEQEGELGMHLYACRQMMPYFFAAGHVNYARFCLCYIKNNGKVTYSCLTFLFTWRTRRTPSRRHMECNLDLHANRDYVYVLWKGNHQTTGSLDMGQKPSFL